MIKPKLKNSDSKLYDNGLGTKLIVLRRDGYFVYIVYEDSKAVSIELEGEKDYPIGTKCVGKVFEVKKEINSAFVILPNKQKAFLKNCGTDIKNEQNIPVIVTRASSKGKLMSVEISDFDIEHFPDLYIVSYGHSVCETLFEKFAFDYILVEDKEIASKIEKDTENIHDAAPIHVYEDSMVSLSALYSVSNVISEATGKCVWLKSGANIVIETTQAMTVIDVNSAKNVRKNADSKEFLKVNMEAAGEIFRQMTLRNLSGIIIVDFINMRNGEDVEELMKFLEELAQKQNVFTKIIDITPLGLVEITRKKTGATVYDLKSL